MHVGQIKVAIILQLHGVVVNHGVRINLISNVQLKSEMPGVHACHYYGFLHGSYSLVPYSSGMHAHRAFLTFSPLRARYFAQGDVITCMKSGLHERPIIMGPACMQQGGGSSLQSILRAATAVKILIEKIPEIFMNGQHCNRLYFSGFYR